MRPTYAIPEVTDHGNALAVTRAASTGSSLEPGSMTQSEKRTNANGTGELTAGGTSDPETE